MPTAAAALVWGDARSGGLAWTTLRLVAAVLLGSVPLGTLLAFLLARTDLPWRRTLAALLSLLPFTPLYLQATAWLAGFGDRGWFTALGWGPVLLQGFAGAVWIHSAAAVPWVAGIVGVGFRLVEPELEEEALLDGSAWQVLRRVTLPGAAGAVGVAALWVAVTVAGEMTVTDLFKVRTYAESIYTDFAVEQEGLPLGFLPGAAIAAWLTLAALLLTAGLTAAERPATAAGTRPFRLGAWRWPCGLLAAAVVLTLIGVPLGNLVYTAGEVVDKTDGVLARHWSPLKCLGLVAASPREYAEQFRWSMELGALAATSVVLVATPLAWWARRGGWRALPALLTTAVALALPGPILGIGWIWFFNRSDAPLLNALYDSERFGPLLALSLRSLPLGTIVLWHALRSLPRDPLEAAATEGAGGWSRLIRVALPQRWPALAAAWLAAFAIALGDVSACNILILPPGVAPLSWRIFDLLHSGVTDQVAALCLAVWLVVGVLVAGLVAAAKRLAAKSAPTRSTNR